MQFLVVDQEIEVLPELICRQVSETLACLERQFKSCTADMVEQDEQVVRVYQRLLRGSGEKVFRMMCQELVKRAGRGDQHCHGGVISASGPTRLLPGRSDGARIPDHQRRT